MVSGFFFGCLLTFKNDAVDFLLSRMVMEYDGIIWIGSGKLLLGSVKLRTTGAIPSFSNMAQCFFGAFFCMIADSKSKRILSLMKFQDFFQGVSWWNVLQYGCVQK